MKNLMEKIRSYWSLIMIVVAIASFGSWLISIEGRAADAVEHAEKVDSALDKISRIAEQVEQNQQALQNPKRMLGDHLITMGESPSVVRYWMTMPVGLAEISIGADSTGMSRFLVDIPFIMTDSLPILGIRGVVKNQGDSLPAVIRTLDTLWDHRCYFGSGEENK